MHTDNVAASTPVASFLEGGHICQKRDVFRHLGVSTSEMCLTEEGSKEGFVHLGNLESWASGQHFSCILGLDVEENVNAPVTRCGPSAIWGWGWGCLIFRGYGSGKGGWGTAQVVGVHAARVIRLIRLMHPTPYLHT